MSFPNNGAMAQRFTDHSRNFVGNKVGTSPLNSEYSQMRQQAMNDIYDLAKSQGTSVDAVITKILTSTVGPLKAYVVSKGETPVSDPTALALQATLLRANDVATTANVLYSDDNTALLTIEAAESDDIAVNSPEADNVLDPVTAAAITCAMEYMNEETGMSMSDILSQIIQYAHYNGAGTGNNLDDIGDPSDPSTWNASDIIDSTTDATPVDTAAADNSMSATSVSSVLAQIPATGANVSVASGFPTISANASSLPQASPSTSSGGILNSLTSIFSGISQAATAVQQAAGSTNSAVNAVKGIGSGIGAASISQYVQNNAPMIILLIIIIIVAIYVARK